MAHTTQHTTPGGTQDSARGGTHRRERTARRALRREAPSTVALLADEEDFAAMRQYASFAFDDHTAYLRQTEGLLRMLASQGVHTSIALFDPVEYEEFCADSDIDPDTSAARTRYTAEVAAAGPTVTYEGQPLDQLLKRLIGAAEQQATWEYATALLSRAGGCGCSDDPGHAAFRRARAALRRLLTAAGPGRHHVVCSVMASSVPLVAVVHAEATGERPADLDGTEALIFSTVLACGIATDSPGGIVLRTSAPGSPDTVRGWSLHQGWLRPLSEAEVFSAYCTDADTGEPVPPEHGVEYRPGIPLPAPDATDATDAPETTDVEVEGE
ncbi:hypothetical protein [Streptomyces milbemycinicus]|uniref:Uncharacterized protein n=1 Tax=Streptomyces milbemycinicus TaxID=476552 RepID=A0ABW8LQS0_9ACTN